MGCASSTEVVTDPRTGEAKTKKKLGGAYPGQRRPQHAPYMPPASEFGKDGQAVAHFMAYGGGNALTLVQQDGTNQPQSAAPGQPRPEYIQVTLPDGVVAGQTIHVQAPDGRLNAIVVPPGFGPGSTFTVEFAPAEAPLPPPVAPAAVPAQYASPYGDNPSSTAAYINNNNNNSSNYPVATPAGYGGGYNDYNSSNKYGGNDLPTATATPAYTAPPNPGYTVPPAAARPDDGFASGFGRR